jgi:DNA-nicking Smr family endonuclease
VKTKRKKPGGPFDKLRTLKEELEKRAAAAKEPPPRAASPRAPLRTEDPAADDESTLLHRLYAGVTPLDRSRGRVSNQALDRSPALERAAAAATSSATTDDDAVRNHLRALVEDRARFEVSDDGARVEGRRIDLPVTALRRLRRGEVPVDGRIDLHGMVLAEARTQLDRFVGTMRARGERCLLVIHGKGTHSPGGLGVLRGEISAWLSQGPASEHIAAFATACPDDGGEGAVYVLLRAAASAAKK